MSDTFKRDIFKIPNILSIVRILLIPVFLYLFLYRGKLILSFAVLVCSFMTDVLDGIIARKYNQITELGKILDPLADKATQIAILFSLWWEEYVALYVFLIILIKELLMGIGAIYLKKFIKSNIIPSNKWGKTATGCFYVSVALLMFDVPYAIYGIYVTLALMLAAFVSYGKILLGIMHTSHTS